jgi:hypothetical protein
VLQGDCNVLFLWWESMETLWDWDVLFLWWDHNSDGLRQQDLLFPNVHVFHVGDLLFIISNVCDAK